MNNRFLTNEKLLNNLVKSARKQLETKSLDEVLINIGYANYLNKSEMDMLRYEILFN